MVKIKVVLANSDGEVLEIFWVHQKVSTPNTKSNTELTNRLARQVRDKIELAFNVTDDSSPTLD